MAVGGELQRFGRRNTEGLQLRELRHGEDLDEGAAGRRVERDHGKLRVVGSERHVRGERIRGKFGAVDEPPTPSVP